MDLKQVVVLALQVSIISIVLGFGLKTTIADLLYLIRRPLLLLRSIVSVFVVMPAVAVALVWAFDFPRLTEIILVVLSISPVPPLLPRKEAKGGGHAAFGLALMAMLALASIVVVPALLVVLSLLSGRALVMPPARIAMMMATSILMPLGIGVAVRAVLPGAAVTLGKVATLIAAVLMPVAVLLLLVGTAGAIWAQMNGGTLFAITFFTVAGLAIGHVLGGGDRAHATVLALSTACRHPALALSIAASNFPDQGFAALVLLYLIVSALVGMPYLAWQRRQETHVQPVV